MIINNLNVKDENYIFLFILERDKIKDKCFKKKEDQNSIIYSFYRDGK